MERANVIILCLVCISFGVLCRPLLERIKVYISEIPLCSSEYSILHLDEDNIILRGVINHLSKKDISNFIEEQTKLKLGSLERQIFLVSRYECNERLREKQRERKRSQ